jgi:hypothetical protein
VKTLTISQPYASLIADGFEVKPVENRRWSTPYRGPLAIHAGKGTQYLDREALRSYPVGKVIAIGQLVSCFDVAIAKVALRKQRKIPRELKVLGWDEWIVQWLLDHEHCEGPFAWVLTDIKKLAVPIPATGKQGLWEWDEKLPEALT